MTVILEYITWMMSSLVWPDYFYIWGNEYKRKKVAAQHSCRFHNFVRTSCLL